MSKADRHDRTETTLDPDRHRDSSDHSPPTVPRPSSKRRSSDHDERERKVEDKAAAAEQLDKYDRKQKGSVFSRISFPDSEKEAKKRKTSLSSAAAAANGVVNDHHRHHHHRSHRRDRDEAVSQRASSVTSSGYKRSSYEHESGEEDEDEDYHFKRRPSKTEREREDEGRSSRTLRGRETKQT